MPCWSVAMMCQGGAGHSRQLSCLWEQHVHTCPKRERNNETAAIKLTKQRLNAVPTTLPLHVLSSTSEDDEQAKISIEQSTIAASRRTVRKKKPGCNRSMTN